MNERPFVLNDSFFINPSTGFVGTLHDKKGTRIRPALMKLLCLLVANSGDLVSRESIISAIWADYDDADAILTREISFLRELLDDKQETIIETVDTRGYVMHALVSVPADDGGKDPVTKRSIKKQIIMACIFIILLAAAYFILKAIPPEKSLNPDILQQNSKHPHRADSLKIHKPDSLKP